MENIDNNVILNIRKVLAHYKANFALVNEQEKGKWEAIAWYKKHWDIDAPDFVEMLMLSFKRASAFLLSSGKYLPYGMLIKFATYSPEAARALFKMLYDENLPLEKRFVEFQRGFDEYMQFCRQQEPNKNINSFQDLRAVITYLSCEYPEKYFLYKYSMHHDFCKHIGFYDYLKSNNSAVWKYESYERLCNLVLSEILKDDELLSLHNGRIYENDYQDTALHVLTQDVIYYGAVYMEDSDYSDAIVDLSDYWPSLDEYDPGLSKEDWKKYILEIELPEHPAPMAMLKAMMDLGGEATCKKLAVVYGGVPSRYIGCTVNLGRRAKKYFDLPACADGDRNRVYTIPFVGRYIIEDGVENYSYRIRPELYEALQEIDLSDISPYYEEGEEMGKGTDIRLNTILYGPPGTGKTYKTVQYAVAILENKELATIEEELYVDVLARYNKYKEAGCIEFTTFHQSYGYEEFIEGIKPVLSTEEENENLGDVQYSVQAGVFKRFCEKAECASVSSTTDFGFNDNPTVWKISLEGTGDNPTRTECMENDHIRIGYDGYGKDITDETDFDEYGGRNVLNCFIDKMQIGDIVLSCYSASTIDAIGVVIGDYEWHDEYEDYKRLRKVRWIVKDIDENIVEMNSGRTMTLPSAYKLSVSVADVYRIIEKHLPLGDSSKNVSRPNYVFIIDEINRGNISKILGELITLIEEPKRIGRAEETKVLLPYSQKLFGVPANVYILGTMNTADRSIATIDTALRRRFFFKEMQPDTSILSAVQVGELKIDQMLERMNQRIAVLYDREHTVGHAYFMPLANTPTLECLAEIFKNAILPLLQEYFYDDYEKIRLVLGDNRKQNDKDQFIIALENNYKELFGSNDIELDIGFRYVINNEAFMNPTAYQYI